METRDVVFRAWDGNKMLENVIPINTNTVITDIQGFPDNMQAVGCIVESIMQESGLKDKNGKDVYEDDVVVFEDGTNDLIVWNDEFQFHTNSNLDNSQSDFAESELEIIGNIHENPELLLILL